MSHSGRNKVKQEENKGPPQRPEVAEGKSAPSSPETLAKNSRLPKECEEHVSSTQSHGAPQGPPSPYPGSHRNHKDRESSESPTFERRSIVHRPKNRDSTRERERGRDSCWEGNGPSVRTPRSAFSCVKKDKCPSPLPIPHQLPHSLPAVGRGEEVALLVDGQTFPVNPRLFTKHPNTMLGRMFGSSMDNQFTLKPNDKGEYEVARGITASLFRAVLDYYHCGVINCPSSESMSDLRETCDYLMIPFNEKTIKTQNISDFLNELSNDGARAQFEKYLQQDLLQAMVQCARKGERECQIVILMEDDVIDWDEQYPPSVGEDHIESVTNSELCRFFKYFENRDIAKDSLREKGLKKIRIGIEGYPTTKEKVRVRAHTGRTEVVYNYVQRPFLRMSWEKDEAKSRHVDFTCVKIKTDIAPDAEAATLLSGNEDDNFDF